jgi:hypothetical protein
MLPAASQYSSARASPSQTPLMHNECLCKFEAANKPVRASFLPSLLPVHRPKHGFLGDHLAQYQAGRLLPVDMHVYSLMIAIFEIEYHYEKPRFGSGEGPWSECETCLKAMSGVRLAGHRGYPL